MKKIYCIIITMAMLVSFIGCETSSTEKDTKNVATTEPTSPEPTSPEPTPPVTDAVQEEKKGTSVTLELSSKSIAKNIVDENSERKISVYLPPSYYDSDKKYPVVYFMHGFSESASNYINKFKNSLDKQFQNGAKEFILVSVDGVNGLGGSFYANSPVSGNWEDYVVKEVVATVDGELRTIADSKSRGMCGFSMGGYAAFNIPFKYPDVFSSFIAFSPGAIADGDLKLALDSWKNDSHFRQSYAQAFSPDPDNTEYLGNIPELSGTKEDNKIVVNWENGFGNLTKKVEDYFALNKPLKAIKIVYGEYDSYSWIPRGCEFLSKALEQKGIEHTIEKLPIAHSLPSEVVDKYFVPFFNENLEY